MKKQLDIMDTLRAVEKTDQPVIAAIDPGSTGGVLVLISTRGDVVWKSYLPTHKRDSYHFVDFNALVSILTYIDQNWNTSFIVEDVTYIRSKMLGKLQNWNFAWACASIDAAFKCSGITPFMVKPGVWQKQMFSSVGKVYIKGKGGAQVHDTKSTAKKAKNLYLPNADLRRTPRCKDDDHNYCDAALIAMYLTRINN